MWLHFSVLLDGDTAHSGNGTGGTGFSQALVLFLVYGLVYPMVKDSLFHFGVTVDQCLTVGVSWREGLEEGARASAEEQGGADKGCFWKFG